MCGAPTGARADKRPLRIEPAVGKVGEDPCEGLLISEQASDIFDQDDGGSDRVDRVDEPRPSPPLVGDTELSPRVGVGLAWESSGHQLNWPEALSPPPSREGFNVVMAWHLRPVLRKDSPSERVALALGDAGAARPVDAEIETADAREQGDVPHGSYLKVQMSLKIFVVGKPCLAVGALLRLTSQADKFSQIEYVAFGAG